MKERIKKKKVFIAFLFMLCLVIWAGQNQRIKYATVKELLKSMWSGRCSKSVYWNGYKGCGGYILVY